MGIIDDIGTIPLKFASEFFKKGYFIYIMIALVIAIIWIMCR